MLSFGDGAVAGIGKERSLPFGPATPGSDSSPILGAADRGEPPRCCELNTARTMGVQKSPEDHRGVSVEQSPKALGRGADSSGCFRTRFGIGDGYEKRNSLGIQELSQISECSELDHRIG